MEKALWHGTGRGSAPIRGTVFQYGGAGDVDDGEAGVSEEGRRKAKGDPRTQCGIVMEIKTTDSMPNTYFPHALETAPP